MNKKFPIFSTAALMLLPMGLSAQIAWDGSTDTTFSDGTNWVGDTAPVGTDVAQLTGGTVDLDVNSSVLGLDVDSASTLTGTGTRLSIGSSGLTGSSDLTLGGSVILRSGTVTSYAGNITIDGATFEGATGTQGFMGTGTITLDNGGTIADTGSNLNMRDTTSIILGSGGGTFRNASNKAFYGLNNAVISGAGQLTLDGGGSTDYAGNARIQIQSAGNTYTGGTLITNKANVQVTADHDFGATTGKVTIDDARLVTSNGVVFDAAREFEIASGGGRISLNRKNSTINGLLTGSGALLIDGQSRDGDAGSVGGTLTLSNAGNTHSGGITIKDVTVLAGTQSAGFLGTGTVTLDNGVIQGDAGHVTVGGLTSIVLESTGGTLVHKAGKAFYGLDDVVISGAGQLTLSGSGTYGGHNRVQMAGTNTYTGGTLLNNSVNALAYNDSSFGTGDITFDDGRLMMWNGYNAGTRNLAINAGGGNISLDGETFSVDGILTGTGDLVIDGEDRNKNGVKNGGTVNLNSTGTGTLTGAVTVEGIGNINVKGQNSLGTGTLSLNDNVQIKNNNSDSTLGNSTVTIESGGTKLMAGWNKSLTLSGVVAGSGPLGIVGDSGTVVLSNAANTYSGTINLEAATSKLSVESLGAGATITGDAGATFIFTGDADFDGAQAWTGVTTIASGASVTGSNTLAGDLTLEAGAKFAYSVGEILTVAGTVALDSTFGVDDLLGIDSLTNGEVITLIANGGDFSHIENFGLGNAFDLGYGGLSAYFQNGSLQLVVVPETSSFALLAGGLALGSVMMRRRRS